MLGGMHTRELAARAGVNAQTLRYYERRGLVAEPPRSAAGYRAYPEEAVARVRLVKRAQEVGFSLDEIVDLLQLAEGGPSRCDSARELAETRIAGIEAKIHDLQRMHDSLHRLLDTCARPHAERECPLLDTLDTAARADDTQE